MSPPRVLFWVQHLLGIGHVRRAALIARALVGRGLDVTVAQGGFPVAGTDFGAARVVWLPPCRAADATFKATLDAEGRPIDAAWRARRAAALMALYRELRPDALLFETFPFGRRAFGFELKPVLDAAIRARPRPVIASLVRDILVAKDHAAKHDDMAAMAERWFDRVLVHGDPALIPFDATFPHAGRIAGRLRYTGYVAADRRSAEPPGDDGRDEILVSVGGGGMGEGRLLRLAAGARALRPADPAWRLLVGSDLPAGLLDELRATASPGTVVERARPDFPALLARCRLSVSQAGYNTVLDVLAAGCRSLLVPYTGGGQTEQALRARLLAERGFARTIDDDGLTPERLADAAAAALAAPAPARPGFAMDGAAETARAIAEALAQGGRP